MLLIGHALIHNHSVEKIYHKTGQILSIDTLVNMYDCIVYKYWKTSTKQCYTFSFKPNHIADTK